MSINDLSIQSLDAFISSNGKKALSFSRKMNWLESIMALFKNRKNSTQEQKKIGFSLLYLVCDSTRRGDTALSSKALEALKLLKSTTMFLKVNPNASDLKVVDLFFEATTLAKELKDVSGIEKEIDTIHDENSSLTKFIISKIKTSFLKQCVDNYLKGDDSSLEAYPIEDIAPLLKESKNNRKIAEFCLNLKDKEIFISMTFSNIQQLTEFSSSLDVDIQQKFFNEVLRDRLKEEDYISLIPPLRHFLFKDLNMATHLPSEFLTDYFSSENRVELLQDLLHAFKVNGRQFQKALDLCESLTSCGLYKEYLPSKIPLLKAYAENTTDLITFQKSSDFLDNFDLKDIKDHFPGFLQILADQSKNTPLLKTLWVINGGIKVASFIDRFVRPLFRFGLDTAKDISFKTASKVISYCFDNRITCSLTSVEALDTLRDLSLSATDLKNFFEESRAVVQLIYADMVQHPDHYKQCGLAESMECLEAKAQVVANYCFEQAQSVLCSFADKNLVGVTNLAESLNNQGDYLYNTYLPPLVYTGMTIGGVALAHYLLTLYKARGFNLAEYEKNRTLLLKKCAENQPSKPLQPIIILGSK